MMELDQIYLTQEGIDRLRKQLARLQAALPALALEAQRTAAYGDRSDNAEYKQAKGALRYTHRQIFTIQDQLKRAVVIDNRLNAAGIVGLGSTVILESEEKGSQKRIHNKYKILGPQETNPTEGCISYVSPLGAALMSHKEGDTIIVNTPSGSQTYQILKVC
jgi:transcription elongation GreA/GreB family factor